MACKPYQQSAGGGLSAIGIAICTAARVGLHRSPILLADTCIITDFQTAYAFKRNIH